NHLNVGSPACSTAPTHAYHCLGLEPSAKQGVFFSPAVSHSFVRSIFKLWIADSQSARNPREVKIGILMTPIVLPSRSRRPVGNALSAGSRSMGLNPGSNATRGLACMSWLYPRVSQLKPLAGSSFLTVEPAGQVICKWW